MEETDEITAMGVALRGHSILLMMMLSAIFEVMARLPVVISSLVSPPLFPPCFNSLYQVPSKRTISQPQSELAFLPPKMLYCLSHTCPNSPVHNETPSTS